MTIFTFALWWPVGPSMCLMYTCTLCTLDNPALMIKVNDIDSELQTNLDKLCKWPNDWQLPISYMKYNVLEIGRPGSAQYRMDSWTVAPVENVDLGVISSIYTVNHKKRDILFLTITLANLNRFLQFLYQFNREEILHATIIKFITSPDLCAHLTWKNQNLHFCRGS